MKIVFTGGGTGGHFDPIIAVAEEIREIVKDENLLEPDLFFLAPDPYDKRALFELGIEYRKISAGKLRRYFSLMNFFDLFKTGWGIVKSIFVVFNIFPDVIFSKGGYGSFPVVLASKIFKIPLIIHESDSIPGKVNKWAGKFARKIAISYPEASNYFPEEKIALTGNPIKKELLRSSETGAAEFLKLEKDVPVIFIIGGSLGSQTINNVIIDSLSKLVEKYQIIHQTGEKNFEETKNLADIELKNSKYKNRYKPFSYLNTVAMKMSVGVADLIISRAGSTIFQIAVWGLPSIIIPITESNGNHQRRNAFNYASTGACVVIEENNLSDDILISQIEEIMNNEIKRNNMISATKLFAKTDSAKIIARELLSIALEHEK
ncbi:UDP-N-acetylglucosamine--N-acetylmuramyl-(pentapeptide) pyrophosphoryl-undecaprenol N-acetylglucosamine transferase [Patescibacteria group bacterium]|nr:UDP-N-acetylglucosamine--N-acetylmuramyl-(pentapeptide) pyrophosphoryl-undecaprenol N-acetylglucosamine transferase [Patescibacteria group bacterium]MBU4057379.1 UDP-N-acetylglucosamine--N-acetylmuramyl-(pentapeptide) pyrophosphoryl-undecaprenol N-acetylglucosamine transferase [Patescibacteria group bacterium]MBU4116006.1 UDP-N-acetylglucosamine--N-acetylmuramyl-(pentapeptide) pyrophosphoryl-undecaprenol N-acetylglucosamine transferase [Patescibacteria group bacterium]